MKLPLTQSLRFRFPLLILLGVASPILVGITLASSRASHIISTKTAETLKLEAKSLTNTVEQWTEMNVLAIQNLSKQPDIISLDPTKQTRILQEIINTYQHIYLAHTTGLDGINIARSDGKPPQNYSDRDWLKRAKAGDEINYQALIGRTSKKPAVCFTTPIRQVKSVTAAAVTMCSSLSEITEQIGTITIGKTGYAFVVDNLGKVIAHPDPKVNSQDNFANFSNYPPVKNLLANNQNYFTFKDETGKEWVSQSIRLDNGWGVVVLQEAAEALRSAKQFQQTAIVIALITISVVGIIIWLLVNRLIEPLQEMTEVANLISQGNLKQKVSIDTQDELGILAKAIDTMAQQLQDAFVSLETQYRENTEKMLEDRNQRLSQQEHLQQRIKILQQEIAPVSLGNLTIRATVTEDAIGTVADSYNQTLDNLSQIILQVKNVIKMVTENTNHNEKEILQLSENALQQTNEIASTLNRVQTMTESMKLVAQNAAKAENSIKQAAEKVKQGDVAINNTVERIVLLGESTTAAKEQVKKLGKASRKISKAVDLIRKIALQTNVLAVNASIEAARAGEEGMGFTVVAEEVQSLATRSAKTATDIEKLVLEIQGETSKVMKVMEQNDREIMMGSQLMKETRASLQQVTKASIEIDCLIEDITKSATEQSDNSQTVTTTMKEIVAISHKTSASATDVSTSFKELIDIAEKLEASINQFQVE